MSIPQADPDRDGEPELFVCLFVCLLCLLKGDTRAPADGNVGSDVEPYPGGGGGRKLQPLNYFVFYVIVKHTIHTIAISW